MIPVTSPSTLGKVLKKYRKDKKLSQTEAGRIFNIAQSSISAIETGKAGVRLETLFKYMAALGLEMHLENRAGFDDTKGLW